MSKSLKKLIDINRLREFKNKLVRMGSAYVQTGAVDQTVAGTKTFSKPIVGSVTGSSGSCTGNAATATTATTAKSCTGNAATATKLQTARTINGTSFNGTANITTANWGTARDITIADSTGDNTGEAVSVNGSAAVTLKLPATIKASLDGNAATATSATTAASATTATNATNAAKLGNIASSGYVQTGKVNQTIYGTKTFNSPINSPVTTGTFINGNRGVAIINSTANAGYNVLFRMKSSHGVFTGCAWDQSYQINYTTDSIVNAGTNATTYTNTLIDENGNATFSNNITVRGTVNGNLNGNVTGNAATATKLQTARTINGTSFNGSANITTAYWGTARNISITDGTNTSTAVSVNGSANVSLNLPATIKANLTGNCSGSSGSCTGNAATATKLAAKRTIALSGAATGTATGFDGSGNITIPVTALAASAIRAQWYAAYPDGAEAHNAMWGGRDITAAFNNGTFSTNVANGTFRDIFPGDYITKQVTISGTAYTVNWVVADCDYWWHKGDQNKGMETHHVVIVPQAPIFNANMNNDNVTTGGYAGSRMYRETIPACATGIVSAFGSDHILTFRDGISNSMDTTHISSGIPQWTGTPGWWGTWVSVQCNLMSEKMVYGAPICSAGAMDNSVATRQMSAFRLSERLINYNRQWWWLRDVVSSVSFAFVNGYGNTGTYYASGVLGVRPFALLR